MTSRAILFYIPLFVFLTVQKEAVSLDCYMCTDIGIYDNCSNVIQCGNGQSCFTASETVGGNTKFTLGCTEKCGYIPMYPGRVQKRDTESPRESCYECCSSDVCNSRLCNSVNQHDGWADWSNWGTCSVSCGTGLQIRNRNCSSRYNNHCFGDSSQYRICQTEPCVIERSTLTIAFQANRLTNTRLDPGLTLTFGHVLVNQGEAYNSSSGVFVAPYRGTYTFNAHVCLVSGKAMGFSIMVGSVAYASTYGRGYNGCECSSIQAIAILQKNARVSVQWKTYTHTQSNVICDSIPVSSFSGLLINSN
ncbi:uncharacterized protein LOC123534013 [Mercenaria mercenaria]|uniref:uncharacterized protein LOC123534013 n=1 Tax=Mercenaria mercenaria TaxID=6596 RepID=UPI00234EF575|nr:uncharacterized protein LOC123534013 [Mercenaria mercenaria]